MHPVLTDERRTDKERIRNPPSLKVNIAAGEPAAPCRELFVLVPAVQDIDLLYWLIAADHSAQRAFDGDQRPEKVGPRE